MGLNKAGRPRTFDRSAALRIALELFWRRGYAATSLDDLTAAIGIGRSSFYAGFTSKHALLLEVLEVYTGELLAEMDIAAKAATSPQSAVMAILEVVACTREPAHGCLFINSVSELMPSDADVTALAKRYLSEVDRRVTSLVQRLGFTAADSRKRSGAMLAIATGAVTLRKAGQSPQRIHSMLDLAPSLMSETHAKPAPWQHPLGPS